NGIVLSEKGRTAAEMLVFARYVMFSEVYWHHAVRSATAMFQRAVWRLRDQIPMREFATCGDMRAIVNLRRLARGTSVSTLLTGLFGARRRLYKRAAQFSPFERPDIYFRIAGRPYSWLVQLGERITQLVAQRIHRELPPDTILPDAPPSRSETAVHVEIFSPDRADVSGVAGDYRELERVSPIIRTLSGGFPGDLSGRPERFDDYVKKVRFLVSPEYAVPIRDLPELVPLIRQVVEDMSETDDTE
ncbi:MAG: metal-dependent phosphohydrolase, partial [Planctomycetia bacterium]|nr:metal-dependent phosphohydrolase [Planctomycetia bacterium]